VRAAEGMAWEKAGDADSAITTYERYLDTPELLWEESDSFYLPTVYQHLATLYEARNDRERSVQHYRTFIALWSTADPELQPAVRAAKQRVEALTRGTDTRR